MRRYGFVSILLVATIMSGMVSTVVVVAASSANLSYDYKSEGQIAQASLVSLDPDRRNYVVPANTENGSRLLGIAVVSGDSLLAVDTDGGSIQVATNGTATALASTVNGDIAVGDRLAVSPFNGVGMKAGIDARVIGVAQTTLTNSTAGVTTQQVADKNGKQQMIHVGYLRVTIGVGTSSADANGAKLNPLQKLARSVTGRVISTVRIVIALVVAIIAFAALIALVYASIFGSIISIGRNPLAKHAVFRTLAYVMVMAVITATVAALVIFLLLR